MLGQLKDSLIGKSSVLGVKIRFKALKMAVIDPFVAFRVATQT